MKNLFVLFFIVLSISINAQEEKNPIEGVWELHYATYGESDTTWVITKEKWKERKVFTKKHFFWIGQELNRPTVSLPEMFTDAEPFNAGSGTYELVGNKYIEHAEFDIYPNVKNKTMTFNYRVSGDSLIISGTVPLGENLGNEEIYEVLIRLE